MTRFVAVAVSLLVVFAAPAQPAGGAAPLPSSLDALYPPATEAPVLLLAMNALNRSLAGIVVDLVEGDPEGMRANLDRFEADYQATSRLVPEWQGWYAADVVDGLRAALEGARPDEVMAAVQRAGAVCHGCHVSTMVPVQQRYHWPDFGAASVTDSASGRDLTFVELMQGLNTSLAGIAVDLDQGQPANARGQWRGFQSLFRAMKASCGSCHDAERTYYVDAGTEALVDQLGRALSEPQPDMEVVAGLSQRIGTESCAACHRVHLPAAYAAGESH